MGTFGAKWEKFKESLHGAAHTTKAQVCKTVDTAKQKNLISRKQHSLEELYAEVGELLCTAMREGKLTISENKPVRMTADLARRLNAFSLLEQETLCKIAELELELKEIRLREIHPDAAEPTEDPTDPFSDLDPEDDPEADPAEAPVKVPDSASESAPETDPAAEA